MVLHIAELDGDFAADATDKVLLVAARPFICSLNFEEVTSDALLILTDRVDALLLDADDNAPVTSLRFGLFADYFSSDGRGSLRFGLLVL